MTTIEQMHPRHSLGFQSDAATAANAALFAGKDALQEGRAAWDEVRASGASMAPLEEADALSVTLRRNANRLVAVAAKTLGLASASACGLWGLDERGRIFVVESTDHGSEYLREVRFVAVAHPRPGTSGGFEPVLEKRTEEFALQDVVAFFDDYADAHNFRISRRG